MANSVKYAWLIILLMVAGVVIYLIKLYGNKPAGDQGVVLNDIFHQQTSPSAPEAAQEPLAKKTDPVPPMAIVTSPVNGHEDGFTIQVYSFQDRARAETALQVLKNSGYEAFLIMSDLGPKGVWYRVRVGGIMDEAQARKMLDEIRKNYNSGFILHPKQ